MCSQVEKEVGEKFDRCVADSLLKVAAGAAIGIVASVAFFRSRSFPIWFGSGIGLGMGWNNCRHEFQRPCLSYDKKLKTVSPVLPVPSTSNSDAAVPIPVDAELKESL